MTWFLVVGLAIVLFAGLVLVAKIPRGGREAIGAALLLGLAGYGLQGAPSVAGAPKDAAVTRSKDSVALVDARAKITNSSIPTLNRWVVTSDAFARNGDHAAAAEVLRAAIEEDPKSSEAWLAMANALVGHADGALTPAASYAYRRAILADPDAPGPPFFLGLALAQEGKLEETRRLWVGVLERAPDNATYLAPLFEQLKRLDLIIAAQKAEAKEPTP